MLVLVTGATGYVGHGVLAALGRAGHAARCLVRRGSEGKLRTCYPQQIELACGDVLEPATLKQALAGCAAAIHLVGIIREFPGRGVTFERLHVEATRNLVEACKAAEVKRLLHMSALGARPGGASEYQRTKHRAEEIVRASGLDWTIFRPSVVYGYGDGHANFLDQLHGLMTIGGVIPVPVVPVIGSGRSPLQPVHLSQLSAGFARALTVPESVHQTYDVAGPEPIAYGEILRAVGRHTRRYPWHLHVPLALMKPLVRVLQRLPLFPLTSDQLVMLEEGNVGDPKPFMEAFKLTPIGFHEGLATQFRSLYATA
ncbi:MAG TPA: complex I NDUFA9 subunit family protein [Acidobacteriota bacterium]